MGVEGTEISEFEEYEIVDEFSAAIEQRARGLVECDPEVHGVIVVADGHSYWCGIENISEKFNSSSESSNEPYYDDASNGASYSGKESFAKLGYYEQLYVLEKYRQQNAAFIDLPDRFQDTPMYMEAAEIDNSWYERNAASDKAFFADTVDIETYAEKANILNIERAGYMENNNEYREIVSHMDSSETMYNSNNVKAKNIKRNIGEMTNIINGVTLPEDTPDNTIPVLGINGRSI